MLGCFWPFQKFRLSVKAGIGNRRVEWGEWWECGESEWDPENQGENAGNQGGNTENQAGSLGDQVGMWGMRRIWGMGWESWKSGGEMREIGMGMRRIGVGMHLLFKFIFCWRFCLSPASNSYIKLRIIC